MDSGEIVECEKMKMKFGIWSSGNGDVLVPYSISSYNQAF